MITFYCNIVRPIR